MNFGNPQRPEIMGQFVGCIDGMAEACAALDFPIVSGNVSLYNETKDDAGGATAILPTPAIGGIGLLADWSKSATIAFKGTGDIIVLVGGHKGHLGQSLWLREVHGIEGRDAGPPPPVDLAAERAAGDHVRAAIVGGVVTACHDVSDGGVAVAVAEMALAGGVGAMLDTSAECGVAGTFFAEDQGLYLVTIEDHALYDFLLGAEADGIDAHPIGRTIAGRIVFELEAGDYVVSLDDLRRAHEGFFPTLMGADAALA